MRRIIILVAVVLLAMPLLGLAIAGSGFSSRQSGQEVANMGRPVPITPLREPCDTCGPRNSFESYTGIEDKQRLVIRDGKAWRDVWKRIYSVTSSTPPLPQVDFTKEMLVVAAMGTRSNGGYAIIIDGANERDDRLEIKVRSISAGKGCMTTQALTAPVDIVRLPKSERTVVFHEADAVHDCE